MPLRARRDCEDTGCIIEECAITEDALPNTDTAAGAVLQRGGLRSRGVDYADLGRLRRRDIRRLRRLHRF